MSLPMTWQGDGIDGMKDDTLYPPMEDMRRVKSLLTQEWSSILTPQILSKWWNCMMNTASHMMQSTTQAGIHDIYVPGERKLRQHLDHMRYPNLKGKWYLDTSFVKTTSVRQHMCGQIFTNSLGFNIPYPLARKWDASLGLDQFVQELGIPQVLSIPQVLITDEAKEETLGTWLSTCRKYQIKMEQTLPYRQWRNLAEASVHELKYGIHKATHQSGSQQQLWCYCASWVAAIR